MIVVLFMYICSIIPIINTETSQKKDSHNYFVSGIFVYCKYINCLLVFYVFIFTSHVLIVINLNETLKKSEFV